MKKLQKMSLNVIKNNMSRNEMRVIKAGSGPGLCACKSAFCISNGDGMAYCGTTVFVCC